MKSLIGAGALTLSRTTILVIWPGQLVKELSFRDKFTLFDFLGTE